ncbi:hypothetical protein ES703_24269 [subsurface metagenome]
MSKEILMAHIDWENIRWRFRDYAEYITLEQLIEAFKEIGKEIGELRQMFFYGDWTRRPEDARKIEDHGCRAINVLSKRYGADRSDPTMMFAIDDQAREQPEVTAFLLGAGDADYKEVILRCRECGKRIYAVCFGRSASRELFTMTERVYPLEVRLNLTEKRPLKLPLSEFLDETSKTQYLIQRIDSLEKALEDVVRSYLVNKILLPMNQFGETPVEVNQFLDQEMQKSYLEEYSVDNPKIPSKQVKCLRLKRDNELVMEALTLSNSKEAEH